MIVWLASYPRSGNTLLRQVLKTCFDLDSCEGLEQVPDNFREPDGIRDEFYGSYFVEGDPGAFYARAQTGNELVLIKSHQLPRDDSKAIYVVRDGRLALRSYVKYQDTYHPGTSSFESLLAGDHPYGEWTSHYRAWCETRRGETLVVRFEELLHADSALLARLVAFIGAPGPARSWVNPQAELRTRDPSFFGTGSSAWKPDAFWTEARLRQFYTLHGPLLVRLGYASAAEVEAGAYPADSDEAKLLRFAHDLAARRNALQVVCDERAAKLSDLKRCADQQATEISTLAETCAARDRLLTELAAQARAAAEQLSAAGARLHELDEYARALEQRPWWHQLPLFGRLRRFVRR